jgi:hypothetical protein
MSTINSKNVQVGTSGTANQNFTLYQPATPDGTVRLGVGNSGATTSDVVTVNSSGVTVTGVVAVPAGSASAPSISPTGDTNTGVFFPSADTIAFAEGGVEVGRFDSSANFQFNSGYGSSVTAYGCRAWVNFNGTGTVAIRASGNVSSITDGGAGIYTVNFTTAMPDANYAVTSFIRRDNDSSTAGCYVVANNSQTKSTSALALRTGYFDNGGGVGTADMPEIGIAIFR